MKHTVTITATLETKDVNEATKIAIALKEVIESNRLRRVKVELQSV